VHPSPQPFPRPEGGGGPEDRVRGSHLNGLRSMPAHVHQAGSPNRDTSPQPYSDALRTVPDPTVQEPNTPPAQETNYQEPTMSLNPSSPEDSHEPGCCADVFGQATPTPASSAAESLRAFGALMRSSQAPGLLDARSKELITFSLVVHSRCQPCFDAHYDQAREMGITQAELDEAAWCAIAMGGAPVKMFYQECLSRRT